MNDLNEHVEAGTYCPEGDLTIYTAAENKQRLMTLLERCKSLKVDLSGVGELDTAGLQLLILAKRESQRRDIDMSIVGHSKAVLEVLDLCNLAGYFGDPVLIHHENGSATA